MKGIGRYDLSPAQIEQERSSLEELANDQIKKLGAVIKEDLQYYADPGICRLVSKRAELLFDAAQSNAEGAYLDAIEHACTGLDLKVFP